MFGKKTVYVAPKIMSDDELNVLINLIKLPLDTAQENVNIFMLYWNDKKKSKVIPSKINCLRHYSEKEKIISLSRIPPLKSPMLKHIPISVWQINEWEQATKALILTKDIINFGWLLDDGRLTFDYYEWSYYKNIFVHAMDKRVAKH